MRRREGDIEAVDKENHYVVSKIHVLAEEIESGRNRDIANRDEGEGVAVELRKVADEKGEMAQRLDALGRRYDDYVGSTTQDKRVEAISSWQRKKRAAAKNLEKLLLSAIERQQRLGLEALEDYCRFDARFQQSLRRVAIIMLKQGEGGLNEALQRWYQKGLKPTETRIQGYDMGLLLRRDANERADY